jgi:hypothetical protein
MNISCFISISSVTQEVKPIARRIYRGSCWVVAEAVKIMSVLVFLDFLRKRFVLSDTDFINRYVIVRVLHAPLLEEFLFRGLLQQIIHMMQKGWNSCRKKELTEEEERVQQVVRVRMAAFVFAAMHYGNHSDPFYQFMSCISTFSSGITYGYLSEKYSSLAPSLLVHGLNNLFVRLLPAEESLNQILFTTGVLTKQVVAYLWATRDVEGGVERYVASRLYFLISETH